LSSAAVRLAAEKEWGSPSAIPGVRALSISAKQTSILIADDNFEKRDILYSPFALLPLCFILKENC
jgi:hypothetical protein